MALSRALLPVGALTAVLLGGCAGAPPPASAPPAGSMAGATPWPDAQPVLLRGSSGGNLVITGEAPRGACDPGDPMAFDPGPRVDSLTIRRVPGGGVASMPNACPVDARFQAEQAPRYVTSKGRP